MIAIDIEGDAFYPMVRIGDCEVCGGVRLIRPIPFVLDEDEDDGPAEGRVPLWTWERMPP